VQGILDIWRTLYSICNAPEHSPKKLVMSMILPEQLLEPEGHPLPLPHPALSEQGGVKGK
jgi:hypothetical protein